MNGQKRVGGRWPARWLAAGGGLVLATVIGVAVVVQTTSGAACAAAASAYQAPPVGTTVHRGQASYYSTSGGGNCSYGKPPADGLFVAMSPPEYAKAAACGGYLDVTGPKGRVRVQIVDLCPGCPVGKIDLSRKAFARVADLADGIVKVTYRAVVNPTLPRSVSFRFKEGTSRYYFALLLNDHGNPLRDVEVRSAGRSWQRVKHADYNYWLADDGLGPGPFDIRITDVYGQRATATKVPLLPGKTQRAGVFLYGRTAPGVTPTPSAAPGASPSGSASPGATVSRPAPLPSVTVGSTASQPAEPSAVASRTDC